MEWIEIEERLPEEGEIIEYYTGEGIASCVGKYVGFQALSNEKQNPMPSAPIWMPWKDVKFWRPYVPIR